MSYLRIPGSLTAPVGPDLKYIPLACTAPSTMALLWASMLGRNMVGTFTSADLAVQRGARPTFGRKELTIRVTYSQAIAPPTTLTRTEATSITTRRLTLEQLAWVLLIALAAVSRFWDLSSRALMHDEAIHAYYSWLLFRGEGFRHDPLMHGPFLFHANALVYFLFGDSDASSRFMPALFGVILVATPWLLRGPRHLGRYGALAASLFFLISPSLLYYTRFIRHDPFTVVGTLLLLVAIFRYIERPERRWLILGALMLGFLYINHEIVFAIAAIFAGMIILTLLARPLRVLVLVIVPGGVLSILLILVHRTSSDSFGGNLPAIPWNSAGPPALQPTPENQRRFYEDLLTHPLVLSLIGVAALTLVACWLIIRRLTLPKARETDADGYPLGWVEVLFQSAPEGTIGAAFRNAWRDKLGLQIGLILAIAIAATFLTAFFTRLGGLATGTFATDGTLLYWLGQQDVQRGEQPWFYFLILTPQYEFIALAFGLPAIALAVVRGLQVVLGRRVFGPRLAFQLFLVGWAVGITVALSYAGEKMPWLIVHIILPLLLLAATLVDELIARWQVRSAASRSSAFESSRLARMRTGHGVILALATALLICGGTWLLLAARLTSPRFIENGGDPQRILAPNVLDDWWQLIIPPMAAVLLIGVSVWMAGATRAARGTLVALLLGLLLLQTHAGFRLSYAQGDVARDSLIYNTTTPDVQRMMSDLDRLSYEINGDRSLAIQYGDDVNWPLYWYMRNFTGSFYRASVDATTDTPVIILPSNAADRARSTLGGTYTEQEYVLRWHEPESQIYRNFAIAPEIPPGRSAWRNEADPHGIGAIIQSIWSSTMTQTTAEGQQRLWRLVFFRENPAATIDFTYSLFIRNDLVPVYNSIHYDQPASLGP